MLPVIIDWNPDLPLIASQAFVVGGQSFRDGDPLPWRELGLDELSVFNMWRAGLVHHMQPQQVEPTTIPVETPRPKRQRTARAE